MPGQVSQVMAEAYRPPRYLIVRRAALLGIALVLAIAATSAFAIALLRDGWQVGDVALPALFFPLFAGAGFGCAEALAGFVTMVAQGKHPAFVPLLRPRGDLVARTAVLVSICDQDADAVFTRIAAMIRSLSRAQGYDSFCFFVLSESTDEKDAAERGAWEKLAVRSPVPVYYRKHSPTLSDSVDGITAWVRSFGGGYDHMLILDADSLMSGRAMIGLAAIMQERPSIGLLQTVPTIIEGRTLFQRWQQFADRLYAPLSTAGILWWSGQEAAFQGTNAMIRTRAYAQSCGASLPAATGKLRFERTASSSDPAVASLLRWRGWETHIVVMDGSYREWSPTMPDQAVFDRQKLTGRLALFRLSDAPGFSVSGSMPMLRTMAAYGASLLWLATLGMVWISAMVRRNMPMGTLLWMTISLLLLLWLPKVLATVWTMVSGERRGQFGGGRATLRSLSAEWCLSLLSAPVWMVSRAIDLAETLLSEFCRKQGDHKPPMGEVMAQYRWYLAFGLLLLTLIPRAPILAAWLSPVMLSLICAPWLVKWTADPALGVRAGRAGLFIGMALPGSRISADNLSPIYK